MGAGDAAGLVALLVAFVASVWLSYQMITKPLRFSRAMTTGMARLYAKVLPGFDFGMYMRALPGGRNRAKYFFDGTTGSPERDASIGRFAKFYIRAMGLALALFWILLILSGVFG